MQTYHQGCPIHILNCYVPPYKTNAEKKIVNHIVWIVKGIFQKFFNSKVIILGDFNSYISQIAFEMEKFKIFQVIPKALPTHQLGRAIDNFFSNMVVKSYGVDDFISSISDHAPIWVELEVTIDEHDLDVGNPPKFVSQGDIRKALQQEEIHELLLQHDYMNGGPVINLIKDQLPERITTRKWYEAPPRYFLYRGRGETDSWYVKKRREWKLLMKEIDEADESGNSK